MMGDDRVMMVGDKAVMMMRRSCHLLVFLASRLRWDFRGDDSGEDLQPFRIFSETN
jgi:hypothetical protein